MREDAIRDRISALTGAIKQGRKEREIEMAQEMFKNNMDIGLIETITKLPMEKLLEIKKFLEDKKY